MNFLEALEQVILSDGSIWAAPANSRGWGITIKDGFFMEVPSDHGGSPAMMPSPKQVIGEWVALSPGDILNMENQ